MASSNNGSHPAPPASEPKDAAEKFLVEAKKILRVQMALEIPDEFFRPEHESELKARVEKIVDAWLTRDKVPIGRQLRLKLLESIFADIDRARRERFPL